MDINKLLAAKKTSPTPKKPEPLHDPKHDAGSMDIKPKPKSKGGRPPKNGKAMSAAERKQAERDRKKNAAT